MFSWKILIQDKDLPKVMWALDGLIVQSESPVPVRGAEVVKTNNGIKKAKATVSNGETLIGKLTTKVQNSGMTTINMKDLKRMATEVGAGPTSFHAMTVRLNALGVLKRLERGVYSINQN